MREFKKPEPLNLNNKPLIEAILELRWEPRPLYEVITGSYFDKSCKEYPVPIPLPQSQIPNGIAPHLVRLQMRTAKDSWPLTQVGPGIITVNDTSGYTWTNFKPRLQRAIKSLYDSVPGPKELFKPLLAELKYINAVPVPNREKNPLVFLRENLHVDLQINSDFLKETRSPESPLTAGVHLTFPLPDLPGVGALSFNTGKHEDRPIIVWEIVIRSAGPDDTPSNESDFNSWLDYAHFVVREWFGRLSEGQLFCSFGD